jgi:ribosomal protein L37AE/L43A
MSERAAPFYCPYCGDEDLRPFGEKHGEWRCGACQRVFRLSFVGSAPTGTEPAKELQ